MSRTIREARAGAKLAEDAIAFSGKGRVMYSKVLGKKLNKYADELMAENVIDAEGASLHNELVVCRAVAQNRMEAANRMRENAIELHNAGKLAADRLSDIERIADEWCWEALAKVEKMCTAQSKILTAGKLDITEVRLVMHQMTSIVDRYAGLLRARGEDPTEMLTYISEGLDEVRVPKGVTIIEQAGQSDSYAMTVLSPADADAEMRAMINTVPYVSEDGNTREAV